MHHPTTTWIPPSTPLIQERWDPSVHLHTPRHTEGWATLSFVAASFSEGLRTSPRRAPVPTWRPSHLQDLCLRPPLEFLSTPPPGGRYSIRPGDVVVSKFLPIQAAWATPSVSRHPPDANCLRVVGLPPHWGLWLAALLSHPGFAPLLNNMAAGLALARLALANLRSLPVPPPPATMGELVQHWSEAAEARLAADQGIADLVATAQAEADTSAPPLPERCVTSFAESELLEDTLAPDQVGLARVQRDLARAGWRPLGDLLVADAARVREDLPPVRVLRLSDADDAFGFHLGDAEPVRQASFRLYAAPLRPAEVLLSLLGSSPKVVLHHPPAGTTVWIPDQWARLRSPYPGALALLLATAQVRWQLSRGTTGVVRQYLGREELGRVRVPLLPAAQAEPLHRRLVGLLEQRRDADQRLAVLRKRIDGMVSHALGGRP